MAVFSWVEVKNCGNLCCWVSCSQCGVLIFAEQSFLWLRIQSVDMTEISRAGTALGLWSSFEGDKCLPVLADADEKKPPGFASWGLWLLAAARAVTHMRLAYPQEPTAPQAVQNSQPSFLITVVLPHSLHSLPWVGRTLLEGSSGASRMPICCRGMPCSSRMPSMA